MDRETLKERTIQKLRYARIHLDELVAMPTNLGRGSAFERAHHEAFLAQLFGAYDAFLIELNEYMGCGLPEEHLSLGKIYEALTKKGKSSPIVKELYELTIDQDSWFRTAKDMRDLSTHVKGIPLSFKVIVGGSGKTALKHPKTMKEHDEDVFVAFSSWLSSMESLIDTNRQIAIAG